LNLDLVHILVHEGVHHWDEVCFRCWWSRSNDPWLFLARIHNHQTLLTFTRWQFRGSLNECFLLTNIISVMCRLQTWTTARQLRSLPFACKANVRTTRVIVSPSLPTSSRRLLRTRWLCICKSHRNPSISQSGLVIIVLCDSSQTIVVLDKSDLLSFNVCLCVCRQLYCVAVQAHCMSTTTTSVLSFSRWTWVSRFPLGLLPPHNLRFWQRTCGISGAGFYGPDDLVTRNSFKGNSKYWHRPGKITHCPYLSIHHRIPEGRVTAAFISALRCR